MKASANSLFIAATPIVLENVLGTSAEMWVRMQAEYDLWSARKAA